MPRSAPFLAKVLGDKTVVLMRGHGSVTVGTSIPQVVFRAYYAEMNARLQSEAIKLGGSDVSHRRRGGSVSQDERRTGDAAMGTVETQSDEA